MEHNELTSSVLQVLFTLNRIWLKAKGSELMPYLHKRIIAQLPDDDSPKKGRSACILARQAFLEQKRVLSWAEIDPAVEVFNDTAVISYRFSMVYEHIDVPEQQHSICGYELMTLVRDGDKWCVVCDHLSVSPSMHN